MALIHHMFEQFPDDTGADIFAREYPTAIAPAQREYLWTKPPLFLFGVPGSGAEYGKRVRRVLEALRQPLDDRGKLAPYALLEAGAAGDRPLTEEAGGRLAFGIPRHVTPDRFKQFSLLRDVITEVMGCRAGGEGADARTLRDHTYAKRVERGGLPAFLWRIGGGGAPPPSGVYGWLVSVLWVPVTQMFPRWWWARRKTRQLIRPTPLSRRGGWLGALLNAERGREDLFRVMNEVAQRQMPRLALEEGHPQREESLQHMEDLLMRALLEDLRVPSPGRLLPRRRRRTTRPVLLVELPPSGARGSAEAERFLRAFHTASSATRSPGPLVIAVGQPSETLLERLGVGMESNLTQAGLQLNHGLSPHQRGETPPTLVTFQEEPFSRQGLPIRQVRPKSFRTSWRTMTALVASGAALAVAASGGWVAFLVLDSGVHACVGGDGTVATSSQAEPVSLRPEEWYQAVYEEIQKQNRRAEAFARQGRTVRTVVHFGSIRPTSGTEALFDGNVVELRGIALWQRKLNDDAVADDSRVPLRVDVRTTGTGFTDAQKEARELVEEIKRGDAGGGRRDYEQVIGVIGYAQSKEETRAALRILGKAGVPAVGTTATADEMLDGASYRSYWPFTPANSTEARISANFASQSNIVARRGTEGGCRPAEHAVVIQSSADLYSRSLAEKFQAKFSGSEQVIDFAQDGRFARTRPGTQWATSAYDLARMVCEALKTQPDSVVYWSARARDFTAFVNAMDTQGTCIRHDLTVLGGNELTNVTQTGVFDNKPWLRLYYSAHRLPATDRRASDKTQQFVAAYDRFVRDTTKGVDPWRQDGHAAVAYDAFHVLSRAADVTYWDDNADPRAMLTALRGGITFDGATGYVAYQGGNNAAPADKTLVLLRQTADGPKAVAVCGAYRQGQGSEEQGAPCARWKGEH